MSDEATPPEAPEPKADTTVKVRGEHSVPIILGFRTVTQEPKIVRRRQFVGFKAGFARLAAKAIDSVLDAFWETGADVLEKGKSSVVRYALQVRDDPGAAEPELVVTKLEGKAHPGCAAYYELVTRAAADPEVMHPPTQPESKAKMVGVRPERPANRNGAPSIVSRIRGDEGAA